MIALVVTINIEPGHKEEFMASMMGDARGSNNDEPGCLRFDVLQDNEDPNQIHLYEVNLVGVTTLVCSAMSYLHF